MNNNWDKLYTNTNLLLEADTDQQQLHCLENAAIAVQSDKIAWLGPMSDLSSLTEPQNLTIIDLNGNWCTPGLIDCHTHLVYAGDRSLEFARRVAPASNNQVTYQSQAKSGGGILATVNATRAASFAELYQVSEQRLLAMLRHGVTTVEIKSGYGLTLEDEIKQLKVARKLAEQHPITVKTTFLGAHTVPPEFSTKGADAYINYVCDEMLPAIAEQNLADAVDVFCETIAFDLKQTEKVFNAAAKYDLAVKCHAQQLSDLDGASLAAQYKALSVDHLEYASTNSIHAMAAAGCVAVLLPGAYYFLREQHQPPIELMREAQLAIALATDCNPGSSPCSNLPLMMNMGCVLWGLTPVEVISAVTQQAATALAMQQQVGKLAVGMQADIAVWDINHPRELAYYMGTTPCKAVVKSGSLYEL